VGAMLIHVTADMTELIDALCYLCKCNYNLSLCHSLHYKSQMVDYLELNMGFCTEMLRTNHLNYHIPLNYHVGVTELIFCCKKQTYDINCSYENVTVWWTVGGHHFINT